MFPQIKKLIKISVIVGCLAWTILPALAIGGKIGTYSVQIVSVPPVVPMGQAKLNLTVTDSEGKPVSNADIKGLVQMPGMPMGETTQPALPGKDPGTYVLPASFGMSGQYGVNLTIKSSQGNASGTLYIATGENTLQSGSGGASPTVLIVILALIVLAALALAVKKLGVRKVFSLGNIVAIAILAVCVFVGREAVIRFRKPGTMPPLEAQTMNMDMPPPTGSFPISVFKVSYYELTPMLEYPATVSSDQDTLIASRVTGTLTWMPLYTGDIVHKGEVIAKIDPSQLIPQSDKAGAAVRASSAMQASAAASVSESKAAVKTARANIQAQQAAVRQAALQAQAADQAVAAAKAAVESAEAAIPEAQAKVEAAKKDLDYQNSVVERDKALYQKGYISKQTLDSDTSAASSASAAHQAALSGLVKAKAAAAVTKSQLQEASLQAKAADAQSQNAALQQKSLQAELAEKQAAAAGSQADLQEAAANKAVSQAALSEAQTNLGYTVIQSPVDGVVSQRSIAPGTLVSPGQTILTITSSSSLRINAEVSASDLARLHVGDSVDVYAPDGHWMTAVLTVVPPTVDPSTRLAMIEARSKGSLGGIRPGDFVHISISIGKPSEKLVIANECIQQDSEGKYVWTIDPKLLTAHRVDVLPGQSNGRYIDVSHSLKEGWLIAMEGASNLHEGDSVTYSKWEGSDPAPAPTTEPTGMQITVDQLGFTPRVADDETGQRTFTFLRTTDSTCATSVEFPTLGIKKELPLNKPVTITLPPTAHGMISYECGMHMLKGQVQVP